MGGRRGGGPGTGTPWARNHAVGQAGEDLAASYLQEQGMEVLERNWRCPAGELDLVLSDGEELVFCEVKTRRSAAFGMPLEAVTEAKAARLRRLGYAWLHEHDVWAPSFRIDLVGILLGATPDRAGMGQGSGQWSVADLQHWRGVA